MKPRFLNVDLEIESAKPLDSLATAMRRRVFALHSGPAANPKRHLLVLESCRVHKDPDATILTLCRAVEQLSPALRQIWNAARKEFDVGYELRPGEWASRFTLRADTLKRMASLGASVAVSHYREEAEEANIGCDH